MLGRIKGMSTTLTTPQTPLPDDLTVLKQMVGELLATVGTLLTTIDKQ